MSENSDASIGVPAAETTIELNSHQEPDAKATVWVASDDGWQEFGLPAGETMEIELPNGETAAIVETEEDDE